MGYYRKCHAGEKEGNGEERRHSDIDKEVKCSERIICVEMYYGML